MRVTITGHGLAIGDTLDSVTGRLGWSALRTNGAAERARPSTPGPARPS